MARYELDHVTLGARHLYATSERLRAEHGLGSLEGGWLRFLPTAHRVIPIPGDAYINVESVIDHHAPLAPPLHAFRRWFEDTTRAGEDRWMTWCLRTQTLADLEDVARRFDSDVVTFEGAVRPDGTVGTTVMAPRPPPRPRPRPPELVLPRRHVRAPRATPRGRRARAHRGGVAGARR